MFIVISIIPLQTLLRLSVSNNQIGVQGAQYLGEALQNNTVRERESDYLHLYHINLSYFIQILRELCIDQNRIGNNGAQYLAKALQKSTVRKRLRVSSSLLFHKDTHTSWRQHQSNRTSRCTVSSRRITKERSERENNSVFIFIIWYRHSHIFTWTAIILAFKVHDIFVKHSKRTQWER
jgi:hypothetical protein